MYGEDTCSRDTGSTRVGRRGREKMVSYSTSWVSLAGIYVVTLVDSRSAGEDIECGVAGEGVDSRGDSIVG